MVFKIYNYYNELYFMLIVIQSNQFSSGRSELNEAQNIQNLNQPSFFTLNFHTCMNFRELIHFLSMTFVCSNKIMCWKLPIPLIFGIIVIENKYIKILKEYKRGESTENSIHLTIIV